MTTNVLQIGDHFAWETLKNQVSRLTRTRRAKLRTCVLLARVHVVPRGAVCDLHGSGQGVVCDPAGDESHVVTRATHATAGQVVVTPWLGARHAHADLNAFGAFARIVGAPQIGELMRRLRRGRRESYWQPYGSGIMRAVAIDDSLLVALTSFQAAVGHVAYVQDPDKPGKPLKKGDWLCYLPDRDSQGLAAYELPQDRVNLYVVERWLFQQQARFVDNLH